MASSMAVKFKVLLPITVPIVALLIVAVKTPIAVNVVTGVNNSKTQRF